MELTEKQKRELFFGIPKKDQAAAQFEWTGTEDDLEKLQALETPEETRYRLSGA